MFSQLRLGALALVVLAMLATSTVHCDCDTLTPCVADSDCIGDVWNGQGCTEAEGHWECQFGSCYGICDPECAQASDCEDLAWPAGAGCAQADGHWECNAGACEAVCDGPECTLPADCESNPWPASAGCAEADGHWECTAGACQAVCDPDCSVYQDCAGSAWPNDADCAEVDGHWECNAGVCEAACNAECNQDPDCFFKAWPEVCAGNWDCIQGMCLAVCDPTGCGDDLCDRAAGEADDSCPADCVPPCAAALDCAGGQDWALPCQGHWDCDAGLCVGVCDYSSCGDGQCLAAAGEDAQSCHVDCFGQCQWPVDCVAESWSVMCQGHWNCFGGACDEICENTRCGDGTCSPQGGESSDACYTDCLGGPCAITTDCVGYFWYSRCMGHWECVLPAGACDAICGDGCGDGSCDVLAGETPTSCGVDCQQYDCDTSADCDGLSLPDGCNGWWLCVGRACLPICGP